MGHNATDHGRSWRRLVLSAGLAVRMQWAHLALRVAWRTNCSSQFHDRLIEIARPRRIEKTACEILDFAPQRCAAALAAARLPARDAAKHALHISIHNRQALVECNAG